MDISHRDGAIKGSVSGRTALEPIDIGPLLGVSTSSTESPAAVLSVADAIDSACRNVGFFTVVGHGVAAGLREELEDLSREFFASDDTEKSEISMALGGVAWRGWFPVGNELTSGQPDIKEGIYFGTELPPEDPRVLAGRPLHGPNLWPERPARFRRVVEQWMAEMDRVGRAVLSAMAIGLGLEAMWFETNLISDPIQLFRIFHYPRVDPDPGAETWGVGAHTDYGLLTLLAQDRSGGLEVDINGEWVPVAANPDALVCNIGDMLDRMTSGRYRSTLHRVRPPSQSSRLSFPFFFDPGWDVEVKPLPVDEDVDAGGKGIADLQRWDGTVLEDLKGTYGEYLIMKVARVFPDLASEVM